MVWAFSRLVDSSLVDVALPISRGMNVFSPLTFLGGLKSNTISLYLTDIAHHHKAH